MKKCNFVDIAKRMKRSQITKTNNYEYFGDVCFAGYLARECFGSVYGNCQTQENFKNGLTLLEEEIGEKMDKIIAEHIDFIHNYKSFEEAKQNVIDILKE